MELEGYLLERLSFEGKGIFETRLVIKDTDIDFSYIRKFLENGNEFETLRVSEIYDRKSLAHSAYVIY